MSHFIQTIWENDLIFGLLSEDIVVTRFTWDCCLACSPTTFSLPSPYSMGNFRLAKTAKALMARGNTETAASEDKATRARTSNYDGLDSITDRPVLSV